MKRVYRNNTAFRDAIKYYSKHYKWKIWSAYQEEKDGHHRYCINLELKRN